MKQDHPTRMNLLKQIDGRLGHVAHPFTKREYSHESQQGTLGEGRLYAYRGEHERADRRSSMDSGSRTGSKFWIWDAATERQLCLRQDEAGKYWASILRETLSRPGTGAQGSRASRTAGFGKAMP